MIPSRFYRAVPLALAVLGRGGGRGATALDPSCAHISCVLLRVQLWKLVAQRTYLRKRRHSCREPTFRKWEDYKGQEEENQDREVGRKRKHGREFDHLGVPLPQPIQSFTCPSDTECLPCAWWPWGLGT